MTRDSGGNGSRGWSRPVRGRASLVVAILLLIVAPLIPGALALGSPAALIGLPAESIIALAVLCLLPWRLARGFVAFGFALLIVVAIVLAAVDAGYRSVLDIPFDPLDWQQLGDALGVVRSSIGGAVANGLVVLLAVAAVTSMAALTWAALRTAAAVGPHRNGSLVITSVTATWLVAALTGSHVAAGQPTAASASVGAVSTSVDHAAEGLAAQAQLSEQIATDPFRDTSPSQLLRSLKGKDVVFAFIESYGEVAVQGSGISAGVRQALREGEARLRADGFASQSAFLTSPTFGGLSWLAHSTFQTGLWIDRQSLYSKVIRSDRFTLSRAFGTGGWRTVGVIPSNTEPWPFGASFYHWDALLDASNVGYRGPSFGYARIPDQYTWKYFADHELGRHEQPIMAELDLVSSHTPWAPLPELLPWSDVGDGSVFAAQTAQGPSATEVWQDPDRIRQAYARSIRYSLEAMFAFLHDVEDPDLVLVVLGDHQPATIVSGEGASRDVPISIIAKDPAVFERIEGWKWQEGMLPSAEAPNWPMSAFRDRFLEAFSADPGVEAR
ncbi:sulfatase [Agromyces sp. Marseille-P2726]|uniref:sulfatase n=1 Tax=Agromyces sp. Marseille-P2726 TaxID=2709132 RepID=UPI001570168A|nr:sulfatase [Agromyces sp. Marseille-P2726]